MLDKMNLYPTLNHFLKVANPPYSFWESLIRSFHYRENIISKTLKNIIGFLKSFSTAIRETKNRGKLRLDLPFDSIPSAIILINNIIPNKRTAIHVITFVHDVPPDVLKLFEDFLIFLNFRDNCIRVDFKYFDDLHPNFFKKFNILVYEERTLIMISKKTYFNICIMDLLYFGIK
jgi:hypothetical protein